jgi:hypothetical protein
MNKNMETGAFIDNKANMLKSNPSLAWQARLPRSKEHGPILS